MQSIYEAGSLAAITTRINKLKPDSPRQWGKMNASQMLAHCSAVIEVTLGDKTVPQTFLGRLIGPLFKASVTNQKPFKKNLPTDKSFIMSGNPDFEQERKRLIDLLTRFSQNGAENMKGRTHPFFGKMTPEDWSTSQVKHLDHHLRQFGA